MKYPRCQIPRHSDSSLKQIISNIATWLASDSGRYLARHVGLGFPAARKQSSPSSLSQPLSDVICEAWNKCWKKSDNSTVQNMDLYKTLRNLVMSHKILPHAITPHQLFLSQSGLKYKGFESAKWAWHALHQKKKNWALTKPLCHPRSAWSLLKLNVSFKIAKKKQQKNNGYTSPSTIHQSKNRNGKRLPLCPAAS